MGAGAADVTGTSGGSGWAQLAAGSATAVIVALIGLYATLRRRHASELEDVNAISIARTTDANLTTYRAETNLTLKDYGDRIKALEDHVRPWPKDKR